MINYKYINPIGKEIKENSIKKIYHYTSAQGLHSILENSTIRFSDVQYLNDRSEYNHIARPLQEAFKKIGNTIHFSYSDIIDYLEKKYETTDGKTSHEKGKFQIQFTDMRYYVFCTSKSNDSLGMWNYYVKNGNYQGYNIGFTVNQILGCLNGIENKMRNIETTVLYGDIIYDEQMQVEILSKILEDTNNNYIKKLNENTKYSDEEKYIEDEVARQECIGEILSNIESQRLFFKDEAFKNEDEFRFVLKLPKNFVTTDKEELKSGFITKQGIFTPFCDLKLDKKKTINSIMISPIMEGDLAMSGLERALKYYDYKKDIKILQSKIPIRY